MKKLFILAVVAAATMTSCKKDYTCTYELLGVEVTAECTGCSKADVKELEDAGYTCE